mgnify:CR=1 FL=1
MADVITRVPGTAPRGLVPSGWSLAARQLRFWLGEPGRLTLVLNGKPHVLTVKRAGYFRVGHAGSVRTLRAYLRDAAGNQSRQVRGP